MASRNFNRKQALEKEIKDLYAKVTIGASGAPTLVTGHGITSITRNGAGDYSLVLADKYVSFKFMEVTFLSSSAQDLNVQLYSEAVNDTKTIRFLTLTGATPTDPANGQTMYIQVTVKNTETV